MWSPEETVVVAVSGGVDSIVLLDVLVKTQNAHRGQLQVITFDHGLRPESVAETHLVNNICTRWGVPCDMLSLNVDSGTHLQERARKARLKVYASLSSVVATGHHANDQAETVLFRLLRGSGPTGLRAMLPRQGQFVRPLLFVHKREIMRYAIDNQLQWLDDPSNSSTTRGDLRRLLPTLSAIRQNPVEVLARTARLFAREEDFFEHMIAAKLEEAQNGDRLDLALILKQHPAVQIRLLRRWLQNYQIFPSVAHMEAFLESSKREGSQIQLSGGYRLVIANKHVELVSPKK